MAEAQIQFRELSTGRFRDTKTGKFIPNPVGIKLLQAGPDMQAKLLEEAMKVAEAARELARKDAYQTGDYMRSIRGSAGISKIEGQRTAVARVNAFDWKAGFIEFGTSTGMTPRAILSRAAEALGYTVQAERNFRRITGTGRERVTKLKGRK